MNSYVEVTIIFGSVLNASSQLLAAWLCRRSVSLKRLLALCWITPALGALMWFEGGVWLTGIAELICAAGVFSFCFPALLFGWGIRFLLSYGLMKLFHGSLLRFQLFLPASCGGWVIVAAGLIGIDVLIQKRLGQGLADTEYLYPVILMLPQGRQRLCGYLDSGNSAVFEGLPLVFVRPSLCRQLQNHPGHWLSIQTVQGCQHLAAWRMRLIIPGQFEREVWLAGSEALEDCGYDVLLNRMLFTVKKTDETMDSMAAGLSALTRRQKRLFHSKRRGAASSAGQTTGAAGADRLGKWRSQRP